MAEIQTYLYGKKYPNRIFVGGLPVDTKACELAGFFTCFGHVTEAKIILDDSGISKGYGFVTFESLSSVRKVESMGVIYFKNKKINIGPAVKKESPTIQPELVMLPSQMPVQPTAQQANTIPATYPGQLNNYQQQCQLQQPMQPYMDSCYYMVTNDGRYWLIYPNYQVYNQNNLYSSSRGFRSGSASSGGSSDDEIKTSTSTKKFKNDLPPRFVKNKYL